MTSSMRASFNPPGLSSPNRDSSELLLPNDPLRRSSKVGGAGILGGDATG